ncbi:hypothetical protein [Propionispora sp. 2/2-37]|uniref:hypothetical protein n=1 Tax=Propionispora sp. 2/2-37 TaxID=1677858 RepID=UPI0012E25DF4|nr:hypothetical protein [Propionispora sp. 2/2-37]
MSKLKDVWEVIQFIFLLIALLIFLTVARVGMYDSFIQNGFQNTEFYKSLTDSIRK